MGIEAKFVVDIGTHGSIRVLTYEVGLDMMADLISAELHFDPSDKQSQMYRVQIDALSKGFIFKDVPNNELDMDLMQLVSKITAVSERIGRIRCGKRLGSEETGEFKLILKKMHAGYVGFGA
ncbi:MAG: hypothetical protein Q9218_003168 [Villophora microphyllina]